MNIKGVLNFRAFDDDGDEVIPIVDISLESKIFYLINESILEKIYEEIKRANLGIETQYDKRDFYLSGNYSGDGIFELHDNQQYQELMTIIKSKKLYAELKSQLEFSDENNNKKKKI